MYFKKSVQRYRSSKWGKHVTWTNSFKIINIKGFFFSLLNEIVANDMVITVIYNLFRTFFGAIKGSALRKQ